MAKLDTTGIKRGRRYTVILSLLLAFSLAFSLSLCHAQATYQEEADRLAVLLNWQPTSTVADIGAGHGQLTLAAAPRVGKIYSTELEAELLTNLEQVAASEKNIVIAPKVEQAAVPMPDLLVNITYLIRRSPSAPHPLKMACLPPLARRSLLWTFT